MAVSVLIIYDNTGSMIEPLAQAIARGAEDVAGAGVSLRQLEEAQPGDLVAADAIIMGCPNWSGITGKLKLWLDSLGDLWEERALLNKIGAAFTTSRSRSAGTEFTLLELLHWMLAAGMLIVGLPWSQRMLTSGSYYGATACGGIQPEDLEQARALGRRVAEAALRQGHP